jgi:hypothetical protein
MIKPEWSLSDFARHYAEIINSPANAWGQHLSKYFGQSHFIMMESQKRFGLTETETAINKAIKESRHVQL